MADDPSLGDEASATAAAELVVRALKAAAAAHERMIVRADRVVAGAAAISASLRAGGTVWAFGNGGSAADAQHFVAELVGRYKQERKGLRAVALTTDTSVLTAVGNDYGFDRVFARQVESLVRAGDVAVGISTSGSSPNVLRALEAAKQQGAVTIVLTGRSGAAGALADCLIAVDADETARIQEVHATLLHVICELVEADVNG